jgi:hypothetical protein
LPKFNDVGDKLTTGAVPVPLRATVCGLPTALSLILSVAVRVPVAVGRKVTLIVQLAPAAKVLPHVCVWEKSLALVPVNEYPLIVSAAFPVFDRVTV